MHFRMIAGILFFFFAASAYARSEPQIRELNDRISEKVKAVNENSSDGAPGRPKVSDAELKKIANEFRRIMSLKSFKSNDVSLHVVDLDNNQTIYSKASDKFLKPASNMKLLTTAAALAILGGDRRFVTRIHASSPIDKNGVLKGDLHVDIAFDFTWSTRFYATGDVPMKSMIAALKKKGLKKIEGKVIFGGYVVYGGTATATLNGAAHIRSAANRFANILKNEKIAFKSHEASNRLRAVPKSAHILAEWFSPVLSEACVTLNRASHNEYADMLLMALGYEHEKKATFEAGARAVTTWLKSVGLYDKRIRIADGSGLSHDNRLSADFLVKLISHVIRSENGAIWAASMSISGVDGTYGGRLAGSDTLGRVLVKSGTLRDVISGSGILINKYDGHTYAFSLMANRVRNKKVTKAGLDGMVRSFAGNIHRTSLPATPKMRFMGLEDGMLTLKWDTAPNGEKSIVYLSDNARMWSKAKKMTVEGNKLQVTVPSHRMFARVTFLGASGYESRPSMIFAFAPGERNVTIVEDRGCRLEQNVRPVNHFFDAEFSVADGFDDKTGIRTTAKSLFDEKANNGAVWWNTGVCNLNPRPLEDEKLNKLLQSDARVVLSVFDMHTSPSRSATGDSCDPVRNVSGCFSDSVVGLDRRWGEGRENRRLRKACGSGMARPTTVSSWAESKSVVRYAGHTIGRCDKKLVLVGFSTQDVASEASLKLLHRDLFECFE